MVACVILENEKKKKKNTVKNNSAAVHKQYIINQGNTVLDVHVPFLNSKLIDTFICLRL